LGGQEREPSELTYLWHDYDAQLGVRSIQGAIENRLLTAPPRDDARPDIVAELERAGGRAPEGKVPWGDELGTDLASVTPPGMATLTAPSSPGSAYGIPTTSDFHVAWTGGSPSAGGAKMILEGWTTTAANTFECA
jgi:hypothetical protein